MRDFTSERGTASLVEWAEYVVDLERWIAAYNAVVTDEQAQRVEELVNASQDGGPEARSDDASVARGSPAGAAHGRARV